jgi:hypothetical protein
MAVIEGILAVVGLMFVILLVVAALSDKPAPPPPPPAEDIASPYREGLHAAVRMQRVAQDLEQQIYAEAAQHMSSETLSDTSSGR